MTKKDYIKIAEALHNTKPDNNRPEAFEEWKTIVIEIAHILADDNPRFDRPRFMEACL